MSVRRSVAAALGLSLLAGCGGGQQEAPKTVETETAAAEVARIARTWSSTQIEKSLLSPPSPISVQVSARTSRLELGSQLGREQLAVDEQFELRSGARVHCLTKFDHAVRLRFGRKGGEAAIEVTRPALNARRICDGTPPEAVLSEAQRRVLLVLSADQLVAVDPPLDERIYRPVSE